MATKQGMCRNCGSLVVFDDRDDMCECIFCNCVFPAEEAVALLENSEGHEFKNEKFEAKEGGKHYYSNPVMPDTVQKAVQREAVSSKGDDLKLKPSEFEVSPNDVKAPKNIVIGMSAGVVGLILIVLLISYPLYLSRTKLRQSIEADIKTAFDGVASAQNEQDSFERQYINYDAKYCELRTSKREGNTSGEVKMDIFTPGTIYHINSAGVTDEVQETVVITESTAASETTK